MISLHEAEAIVLAQAWGLPVETVPLGDALGRVLAQDAVSDLDMPPWDKAAVDGYACRLAEAAEDLRVVEVVAAGAMPTHALGPGECAKVMTGAPLPAGADGVIMVEHTREAGPGHIAHTGQPLRPNRCLQGEDLRTGDVVLRAGTRLLAQHLAVLATVGVVVPQVGCLPRVGVFATGSELVPPGTTPKGAQIRNSNGPQLVAQLRALGISATDYGIFPDDAPALRSAMQRALAENDVVLSTGGVSMGDYDLVPDLVAGLGLAIHLRKVAIQPGKPILFATGSAKAYFGLSGNPLSSLVQFELFVKPMLLALQGAAHAPLAVSMPLGEPFTRKQSDRMAFVPVRLAEGRVWRVPYHGSAHIGALVEADGLVAFPTGVDTLNMGHPVAVRLVRG